MRTIDEIKELQLFLKACETGSFARAASLLGLSRAAASRQISALETKLNVALFVRDTNGVFMTSDAVELKPQVEELLSKLQRLTHNIESEDFLIRETIQISAPSAIGHGLLIPWIATFQSKKRGVIIDITHSMGPVRVMPAGCDIRITHSLFPCERVITHPLGDMLRMMVASPDYLAKYGMPQHPEELVNHSLLGGNDLLNGNPLVVVRGHERIVVPYLPRLKLHDHLAAREAALAGAGIAVHAFKYNTLDYVSTGRLIHVLPDWQPESTPVSMLFPATRPIRPIVHELADYLEAKWRCHPYLSNIEDGEVS